MSILITLNHLYSNFFMEFLKDPSLVLYSSSYTPLLSVLSYLIHQQTTNSMLMIRNFSLSFSDLDFSHNITHLVNAITFPTGCHPISCLLIFLKLSFSSLVYHNNSLNLIILPFIYLTMQASLPLVLIFLIFLNVLICPDLSILS